MNKFNSQIEGGKMNFFQEMSKITAVAVISAFDLTTQMAQASHYQVIPLVSNLIGGAPNVDPNLINPWGFFFTPNGNFWVADNGSDVSTLYTSTGSIINFVIQTASSPTGALRNSTPC